MRDDRLSKFRFDLRDPARIAECRRERGHAEPLSAEARGAARQCSPRMSPVSQGSQTLICFAAISRPPACPTRSSSPDCAPDKVAATREVYVGCADAGWRGTADGF